MSIPQVILKPKRAQPFFSRHPWVFAGAIDRIVGDPADGSEVELRSSADNFIARGLYNSKSKIAVRLYSWTPDRALDESFFRERIEQAIALREQLGLLGPDQGCRLIFSEGDILSGCTLDKYGEWLAIQFTSLGMAQRQEMFLQVLQDRLSPKGIYLRTERGVGKLEGLDLRDSLLWGDPPPSDLRIREGELEFQLNLPEGQKTGFYLDQRDNRAAVARLARGARVLDGFCYTGGFGLSAARGGAASVDCVDASESALELAKANATRNGLTQVHFTRADVFNHLTKLVAEGKRYDIVVLDPPKFARTRRSIPEAIKGYRRLQSQAVRLLPPGGILVTCCCSGLITVEMLNELLGQIATEAKRDIQILSRLGQPSDHPVAASCLESSYLKCFICRVL